MTLPFLQLPPIKNAKGVTARELAGIGVRTGENGGEPPTGFGPLAIADVPLPIFDGGDVTVLLALPSVATDYGWAMPWFDSRGFNQMRVIVDVEEAGSSSAVIFAEQTDTAGGTFTEPGVSTAAVAANISIAGPRKSGWVTLGTQAVGERVWRARARGGDGATSPAIKKVHFQFRNAPAEAPPAALPTGEWGTIFFDLDALGTKMRALGYGDGADANLWPDETANAVDMSSSESMLLPKYRATGFRGLLPCVEWDGSNVPLGGDNPSLALGTYTYYLVIENLNGGGDSAVVWGDPANASFAYQLRAYNDKLAATNNNLFGALTDITDDWGMSDAQVYRFVKSAGDSKWYMFVGGVNKTPGGFVANAPQTNDTAIVTLMNYLSGLGVTGRVAEIVGYDKAHIGTTPDAGAPEDGLTGPEIELQAKWFGSGVGGGGGSGSVSPPGTKPDYLGTTTDPDTGATITRITGDVGDPIPVIGGANWRNVAYHNYPKDPPWSADEAYIALKQMSNIYGGGTTLILDGITYAVVKETTGGPSGGGEWRWHPTEPDQTIILNSSGAVKWWNPITDSVALKVAAVSGYTSNEMGPNEGNPSYDGAHLVAKAIRSSDGHLVARVLHVDAGTVGPVIDLTAANITSLDWVSMSAGGGYVVAFARIDGVDQRIKVWDASTGALVQYWTDYKMGHLDLGIDALGNEVAFSLVAGSPSSRCAIMRRLDTGAVDILSAANSSFNWHAGTRAYGIPVGTVSVNDRLGYAWDGQIVTVGLAASPTITPICSHYSNNIDYDSAPKAVMSPSGTRILFASNWGDASGRPMQTYVVEGW